MASLRYLCSCSPCSGCLRPQTPRAPAPSQGAPHSVASASPYRPPDSPARRAPCRRIMPLRLRAVWFGSTGKAAATGGRSSLWRFAQSRFASFRSAASPAHRMRWPPDMPYLLRLHAIRQAAFIGASAGRCRRRAVSALYFCQTGNIIGQNVRKDTQRV